jgi:predicted amidohydrolase
MVQEPEQGVEARDTRSPAALIAALRADTDTMSQVAVLWTWLEQHLLLLGSLRSKGPAIRCEVASNPRIDLTEEDYDHLSTTPVPTAARLLAMVHAWLEGQSTPALASYRKGVDGELVLVMWRNPVLALRLGKESSVPPPAVEHPALAAIAPRLVVSCVERAGIAVNVLDIPKASWGDALQTELNRCVASEGARPLSIHLDALGDVGYPRLKRSILATSSREDIPTAAVGWFEPDETTEAAAATAVQSAVAAASGPDPSILLLPELAASESTLAALVEALRQQGERGPETRPPAMTVVGLLHREPGPTTEPSVSAPHLTGSEPLAQLVNEAVVLSADGEIMWTHRKLSSAQLYEDIEPGVKAVIVEDIQLGSSIAIAPTPIGSVAVVICLDAFAGHVRDRLATSPADVLLVPSLSPKVSRHRTALAELVQRLWGVAFVCNRCPPQNGTGSGWNEAHNRSFYVAQRGAPIDLKAEPDHPVFIVPTTCK